MIFTSSSVTSFQDYRLEEKSIQNTSFTAGLVLRKNANFSFLCLLNPYSPRVKAEFTHIHTHTRERGRGSSFSAMFGSWLVATFALINQSVDYGQAPNL